MVFEAFGLSGEVLKAVSELGFEEPTPIQVLAIPKMLLGNDITGQAETGTGKTAAFGIPVIEKIERNKRETQALVLCPTRELAIQVAEEFSKLLKYIPSVTVLPVYGGQAIDRQIRALKGGVQIIIATPGRLIDHIDRGTLNLKNVKMLVLDEGDQMLDMGFRDEIETIIFELPKNRQTVLFSATMPKPILEISQKFQKNPIFIKVPDRELIVPGIEQFYIEVKEQDKLEVLCRVIDMQNPPLSLIFTNTKRAADYVTLHLNTRGYLVEGLHGDMKQQQRDRVMGRFRARNIDILVATDVAARGIDVEDIDTVFNYDVPQDVEYYVHRIGRTGRAGKTGKSITFVSPKEIYKLRQIQRYANIRIARIPVPTLRDIEETRTQQVIEQVREIVMDGGASAYQKLVEQMMQEEYSSMEIAAGLIKIVLDSKGDQKGNGKDYNENIPVHATSSNMEKLSINIGRERGIRVKDILGAIAGETGVPGRLIGAIEIQDRHSYVEVPSSEASHIIEAMHNKTIRGYSVILTPAKKRGQY